jgi:hypothetical protein
MEPELEALTDAEKDLDLKKKLQETEEAICFLSSAKVPVPPEAIEIRTFLRRAIMAEARVRVLEDELDIDGHLRFL